MKNDQPLDYRLRVATKRTDLPEDVIRLLADAYYEIWLGKERVQVLQDKCDSLLSTNVELEVRIKSIKEGFEGCCTACEPVGEIISMRQLLGDTEELRKERDEARREVLEAMHPDLRNGYAAAREWDCFKEEMACDTLSQEVSQEGSKLPATISSNGIRITEYIPPQNSVREIPPYGAYTTGECTLSVHTIKKTQ